MLKTPKRILVIGSGAIGSFYASKLAKSSAKISILARSDYNYIHKHGIHITHPNKTIEQFTPDTVLKYGCINSTSSYDYIIVCTKVLPSIDFSALISPFVSNETTLVLIQNGIDIESTYLQAFPNNELISGLAFICVSRTAPGKIHHEDYGKLTLGCFPNGQSRACDELVDLFCLGGADCHVSADIAKDRFIKLLWNAAFNPLSVTEGGVTTEQLLSSTKMEEHIRGIMAEISSLAVACGHQLPHGLIDSMIKNTKTMTPYKTSMLLDYERGHSLETEAILGNSLRLAKAYKLKLPVITALYKDLKAISNS